MAHYTHCSKADWDVILLGPWDMGQPCDQEEELCHLMACGNVADFDRFVKKTQNLVESKGLLLVLTGRNIIWPVPYGARLEVVISKPRDDNFYIGVFSGLNDVPQPSAYSEETVTNMKGHPNPRIEEQENKVFDHFVHYGSAANLHSLIYRINWFASYDKNYNLIINGQKVPHEFMLGVVEPNSEYPVSMYVNAQQPLDAK
jgi:hypothetical protein